MTATPKSKNMLSLQTHVIIIRTWKKVKHWKINLFLMKLIHDRLTKPLKYFRVL